MASKIPGYRLHRKIGQGGMAVVYLATQESFDRKVALKIIANKAFGGKELAERFRREAKIVASLSHPHIVPVYDVGSIGNYQYLAMDYLQGGELKSWIQAGLEPAESVQILMQIAQALHFAHNKGYVHRDIKPGNIMFREDNSAVLTDFGIAKPLDTQATDMTQLGLVVGTPAYMSPEQAQAQPIDGRADLYSLGVIFYLMLTKELPYQSQDPLALVLKHINDPIPQLPEKIRHFQPIIDQLLAKSADDRFESGMALCKALSAIDPTAPAQSATTSTSTKSTKSTTSTATPTAQASSELALMDNEDISSSKDEKSIEVTHDTFKKFGFLKRHAFKAVIRSTDMQQLNISFSQATINLLDWYNSHGKHCKKVAFDFFIRPSMEEKAHSMLKEMYDEGDTYNFLKKMDIDIKIYDSDKQLLSTSTLKD